MNKEHFVHLWKQVHGLAEPSGIVMRWLSISFFSARICSRLKISANSLTLLGVVVAGAMVAYPLSVWCIPLLVFSLFCDGIDGSVAIYQNRQSSWGAVLDSVADRITEALWLFVAYKIGVPAWVAIVMWLVASTQEYMRARIASLGIGEIDIVTPAERPMRASFLFVALVAFHLGIDLVNYVAFIFLAIQVFSIALVGRNSYRALHS
jgi:archaetidylinositol phosphate synthase